MYICMCVYIYIYTHMCWLFDVLTRRSLLRVRGYGQFSYSRFSCSRFRGLDFENKSKSRLRSICDCGHTSRDHLLI